ncbi:MAG: hypothetical protein AAGD33_23800 [Actinomycetota bacterium]
MRGSTKRVVAGLCCAALAAAACSGDDESDATAPVPSAGDEESAPSIEESTPDVDDSVATESEESEPVQTDPPDDTETPPTDPPETTTTTTESAPERRLPEDLGPVTDSIPYPDAPGVDAPGEFYEIYDMGYVYLPFEDDPGDPNVVAPTDEQLPVIAAYVEAQAALASQTFVDEVSAEPNDRVRAAFVDRGESWRPLFSSMASAGERDVFLVDAPTLLRPKVPADSDGLAATVLDCGFLSSNTVDAEGQPISDSTDPYFTNSIRASLVRIDGEWIVDFFQQDDSACV